ncbi:emp24/gp25L/p24 family/GOLD-domain-containing protein [Lobosporangium transversale]|uniref:Emp24/gp25L/p24 family/GOLD-domain-containing protein n=1 Tax=Lobosporangium transversale TaxID=64571 RepID=A0A1Y2H4A9_9FUNG|nr:emp24/gp25L/p24 family/GOLD-domain-containing protein [Lobosporangium transversale]ORZ28821.1 emp24/gp25L/p24 family/GOLD-domain-containing protein [Lobosporangium transversale]|eukprot:XP_021886494.1 emp24/gp25L/p24 family/GOLD-domain-containing protein [Lobosporangium transversale]
MAINITRWTLGLLMLLSILPSVFGIYFYLEGAEQKCFTEELPKETVVTGVYTAEEWNEAQQKFVVNKELQLEVIVEEMPDGNRIHSQKLPPKGKFKFTSAESGQHNICLFASTAGWFSSTKIRLNLDLAVRDLSEESDLGEGTLSELAQRVRELNYKVSDIRIEQSYHRDHEREFRDVSERTNSRTVTWTIVQLVVLGITCTIQLRSLRKFFETKKLV